MDHSSASNYPIRSAIPKPSISGETNENDIEQDQMNSQTRNSKKPAMKHFMSPTISATSKTTVPRKKILAERNESLTSFEIHPQKSPKLHPGNFNCDQSSSRAISANNCISQSDDDEHNASFSESSLKPYDPLTNYLSPRPKYLRYNPNRRREILNGQEPREEKGDAPCLQRTSSLNFQDAVGQNSLECGLVDSFSCPPQEGSARRESQEIVEAEDDNYDGVDNDDKINEEEEDDETEEFEEEKGWSFKGVLKFLLLLIVIILSTSYISYMNTPTPSLIQQAAWGVREGCYRIQKNLYEAMSTNLNIGTHEIESSTQTSEAEIDMLELNKQNSYVELGSFQMVAGAEDELMVSSDGVVKLLEPQKWQNEDISDNEFDKRDDCMDHLLSSQTKGLKDAESILLDFKEVDFDWPERKIAQSEVLNFELVESSDGVVKLLEPQKWQNEDISDNEFDKGDDSMDHLLSSQTKGIKDADRILLDFNEVDFDWPERKIAESEVLDAEMDMLEDGSYQVPRLESAKTDESTEQALKTVERRSQQLEVLETSEKFESFLELDKLLQSKRMDDQHTKFDIGSTRGHKKPADLIYEADGLGNNYKVELNEGIFRKKEAKQMVDKGLKRTEEIVRTMEDEIHYRFEIVEAVFGGKTGDEIANAKWLGHEGADEDSFVSARVVMDNSGPDGGRIETKEEPVKSWRGELGLVSTASIGFFIFAIFVGLVSYVYCPRAIQAPVEYSQPLNVPSEESERNEKLFLVHSHMEGKRTETKVESIVKPPSIIFSTREAAKELSDIQAPEVQLLGELAIGKVGSSSLKSCSRRSKTTETEESSNTISHVESRANSGAPAEPSTLLDTASTDSPSYGSFTAEKKILKKERGIDGDVKIFATPVRRSSRIRNRTVTSP